MFLGIILFRLLLIFFYLWGDYIKILIGLELISLVLLTAFILALKLDYFSLNYFFMVLIFLVCESRIGFLLFIFYISIERELVKKLILVQL